MDITFCDRGDLYKPRDFALALPCNDLAGFLNQVYLSDFSLHRQSEGDMWLLWSHRAVKATLQEVTAYSLRLTETERLRFLLQLLHNVSLCANKFCPLTRGIGELKSDTRIGALGEIVTRFAEQAIIESKSGEVDLPKLLREVIQIARFGGCEYSLFDAAQGLVAGTMRPEWSAKGQLKPLQKAHGKEAAAEGLAVVCTAGAVAGGQGDAAGGGVLAVEAVANANGLGKAEAVGNG